MPLVIIVDPLDRLTQPAKGIEVQPYTAMFLAKLRRKGVNQLVRPGAPEQVRHGNPVLLKD